MQTIELQVKDGYTQNILDMLESVKGTMLQKIEVKKDPNLEYDPYFYERKAQLDKTIKAVDDGSMKMYNQDEYDEEMDSFMKDLELKYAHS
jgi:hypothetical protein